MKLKNIYLDEYLIVPSRFFVIKCIQQTSINLKLFLLRNFMKIIVEAFQYEKFDEYVNKGSQEVNSS